MYDCRISSLKFKLMVGTESHTSVQGTVNGNERDVLAEDSMPTH